jgi:MerR family transcriptional regulator, copper efflux regulator
MDDAIHIGEVAGRTGLSLRTVRYYESVGLVTPSGRTEGGFRLYTEPDVQRLLLIRSLKAADLTLERLEELITLRDDLRSHDPERATAAADARYQAIVREAELRLKIQRERLAAAELALELLRSSVPTGPADIGQVAPVDPGVTPSLARDDDPHHG